ncbi:MAG: helix-turn-helix transcriptional regulator [Candidatus Marinimicrobia bacterium]|nr:helix-turn-helix transcriptional regulator [Candidatus Neomarinimicrobiota bacterium]
MKNRQICKKLDQLLINQLSEDIKNNSELKIASEIFAILGNLSRLRILYILSETGQCCVHHLAGILDMSMSNVSHHLRKMRDRQIVKKKRQCRNIFYHIASGEETNIACRIIQQFFGNDETPTDS